MFEILFGWRKASKCKRLIKRLQCRLKLLKNKRFSVVRHLKEDVGKLINGGYHDIAFHRVEQIYKDETIMELYDMLDNFCEFVKLQLSYIRRHKDCPNDINEAVSTLMYASARCGDLPELPYIRKLFEERYGQIFANIAVEFRPGNFVNPQVKEKLSSQTVSDIEKYRLLDDITRECCIKPEILALEYTSQWKQQVRFCANGNKNGEHTQRPLEEISITVDSSLASKSSSSSDILQYSSPDSVNDKLGFDINLSPTTVMVSSSESSPRFNDETIVYLDDIDQTLIDTASTEKESDKKTRWSLTPRETYSSSESLKLSSCCLEPQCACSCTEELQHENFVKPKGADISYLRAATMPQERSSDNLVESVLRSKSFPVQNLKHVHPNLPEYDNLESMFAALKKENQQKKTLVKSGLFMY